MNDKTSYWSDLWQRIKPSKEEVKTAIIGLFMILVGLAQGALIYFGLKTIVPFLFSESFLNNIGADFVIYIIAGCLACLLTIGELFLISDYAQYRDNKREKEKNERERGKSVQEE